MYFHLVLRYTLLSFFSEKEAHTVPQSIHARLYVARASRCKQASKQKTMIGILPTTHQAHKLIDDGTPLFGRILDSILKGKWEICKYPRGKLPKTHCRHCKSQMKKDLYVPYSIGYGKPYVFLQNRYKYGRAFIKVCRGNTKAIMAATSS